MFLVVEHIWGFVDLHPAGSSPPLSGESCRAVAVVIVAACCRGVYVVVDTQMATLAQEVAVLGEEGLINRDEFVAAMLPKTKYLDVRPTRASPLISQIVLCSKLRCGVGAYRAGCASPFTFPALLRASLAPSPRFRRCPF